MTTFVPPVFDRGQLELRLVDNEVGIYGTRDGLRKFANLVLALADNPTGDHVHIEDYGLLTQGSLIGVVVLFRE